MPLGSKLYKLTIIIIIFRCLLISATLTNNNEEELEELLAIDEELKSSTEPTESTNSKLTDTETLKKAQRVVLELTNENAQKVVNQNEMVLVLGYTPWCPRSADLMPRFAEAAVNLKEMGSKIVVGKIDAERYGKGAGVLGIKGYPTILLFLNGSSIAYTGGFTGEEIVIWTRKKTGDPVIRLSSVSAAEEFVKQHLIYVVGLFDNFEGIEYEEYVKAATTNNEIQFVEVQDLNIAKVLFPDMVAKRNFIGLVKSEPERFETFEDSFEEEKILQFVEYNKFNLVTTLTEHNSAKVYSSPVKIQVFIFAKVEEFEHLKLTISDVARKYKPKIMFVYVDSSEDNLAKPFLTLFGIEADQPIVTAFDNKIGSKYLLESDLTISNLEEFCSNILHGTLSPYYKSEPIPEADMGKSVEKIVGRSFDALVLNSSHNIFLEVYTPWCMDCEATSRKVEKLAKYFKEEKSVKFARIDASLNEHPKLHVNNFPTLLFYPAEDKLNPITLSKKSTLKELATFIRRKMKAHASRLASQSNDDQMKDEL